MTAAETASDRSRFTGRGSRVNAWLVLVLLGVVAAMLYRQRIWLSPLFDSSADVRSVTPRGDLSGEEKSTIEIFQGTSASVVHITTVAVRRNVFTMDVLEMPAGTGSGLIWDRKGHIVTNLHVIRDAQGATVTLKDNTNWPARLVGYDTSNDLAVLKIEAESARLKPIPIGTSHDLQVGQRVFAIGSPFEFDHTLTTGIIGGLNRAIRTATGPIHGAIQTDAAINPGNSGGPLLDSAGRLIGVNTAIVSESGGSHGIGFAVPVDVVNLVIPDLIRDGKISRPWLGVVVRENFVVYDMDDGRETRLPGLLVEQLIADGPADRAGILSMRRTPNGIVLHGDQIVEIEGRKVETLQDLLGILSGFRAGDVVSVSILRDGNEQEVRVVLEDRPE